MDKYSCEGCPFADPDKDDPDAPDAECQFPMDGVCWKEVQTGKMQIWQDDFGNLMAIPSTPYPVIGGQGAAAADDEC